MNDHLSRRALLRRTLAGGAALGIGHASLASSARRAVAAATQRPADAAARASHVEPLVRLLESTPRDRVVEAVGEKIRHGAGYRDVLAALLLAGVREVQPRPSVGYKFHTVVAMKGDGAHDFKFTSAALESFQHVSPSWRARYLACGAMHFNGPDQRDHAVVSRARKALGF